MKTRAHYLMLCATLVMAGCSKGPSIATYPITGTVTYQGKPLSGASVFFIRDNPDAPRSTGTTDADGKYTLTTYFGPQQILKGAVADKYRVIIVKDPPPEAGSMPPPPADYGDPEYQKKSLENMIKQAGPAPGANGRAAGTAPKPKPKPLIPERYANPETSGLVATVVTGQNDPIDFKLTDE